MTAYGIGRSAAGQQGGLATASDIVVVRAKAGRVLLPAFCASGTPGTQRRRQPAGRRHRVRHRRQAHPGRVPRAQSRQTPPPRGAPPRSDLTSLLFLALLFLELARQV